LKAILVTFADGSKHWADAAKRLSKTALKSRMFDSVEVWNLDRIKRETSDFWRQHSDILNRETRGFGYWLWKPLIILETLKRCSGDFDVLVYLDAGCTLNYKNEFARKRFLEYCQLALVTGGVAFQIRDQTEVSWNKMDTVRALTLDESILETNQLVGGISMFANVPESIELLERWLETGVSDRYHLIDDSPSREPNVPKFVAHRHDQSIWSLLVKQSQFTILEDETYFGGSWKGEARRFPFWATRNSTGISASGDFPLLQVVRKIIRTVRN
jgi:hypothetical protein